MVAFTKLTKNQKNVELCIYSFSLSDIGDLENFSAKYKITDLRLKYESKIKREKNTAINRGIILSTRNFSVEKEITATNI